ncbi:tRNA (guanosine(46)-N7)-methyltransferase TrmB [Polluticoccus soli]|uniref:tRNA (guanosine(46)-N7)-methyltransferase TrmB n=1 Tax=Polluticoccus soli TaxID=3034150 RepID=UPI0023E29C66|nr:tRNA (guanosine(46)-N7)-methyltransferase TrmB [Flavipsychrobacter sp. JY13-12]
MGHKKLIRFNAINNFSNVLQKPEGMKGKWHEHFKNNNPITLELACGKGEYSVNLGREHKDRNFIGVDIKGNRIYNGAKIALTEGLTNVGFLRIHIGQIDQQFAPGEVDEIWIIFPDPFLRESRSKNRLTHARFLNLYQQIMKPGGRVNLKTDSKELYDFTLESIAENNCTIHENLVDIYGTGKAVGPLAIQTFYEKMHLAEGRTIYFISFSLPAEPISIPKRFEKDEPAEGGD